MDTTQELNALMQFYRQNVRGGGGGMTYGSWASAPPDNGAGWAMGMLDRSRGGAARERPDFFSAGDEPRNALTAYAEPERFGPVKPVRAAMPDSMQPMIRNYLARFFQGR